MKAHELATAIVSGRRRTPVPERLWRRVDRSGGPAACWNWPGARNKAVNGYGMISAGGKCGGYLLTHRVAWECQNGPIPDGMVIAHKCDNPICCNPDHLFLATQEENLADMRRKGRHCNGDAMSSAVKSAHQRGARKRPPPKGAANPSAKLSEAQALEIRQRAIAGEGTRALEAEFGLGKGAAWKIKTGKTWGHLANV